MKNRSDLIATSHKQLLIAFLDTSALADPYTASFCGLFVKYNAWDKNSPVISYDWIWITYDPSGSTRGVLSSGTTTKSDISLAQSISTECSYLQNGGDEITTRRTLDVFVTSDTYPNDITQSLRFTTLPFRAVSGYHLIDTATHLTIELTRMHSFSQNL